MKTFEEILLAETSEHDFKEALEIRKPKDWLKTVSAFANSAGGTVFFGVADDRSVKGLADLQRDAEKISELIKARITPLPVFTLAAHTVEGKEILALVVPGGETPPYFYQGDGSVIAYVRIGNESVPADANRLRELAIKGKNITFDSLPTDYKVSDLTFTVFDAMFKRVTKKVLTQKEYTSFGLCLPDGTLTYAGLLFADDCPLRQARVFCTHWDGLTKGSLRDAIDSKEFEGDLVSLLKDSDNFARLNTKVRWKKMSDHRVNKPDYADRAVFEALANALMHRDWSVVGSEVHVDIYDDRMEIYSPGGMPDGTLIQERDIDKVPSIRRNPAIADVFGRLEYAERQGSGLKRIREETSNLYGYTDDFAPIFESTPTTFFVILKNMNYSNLDGDLDGTTNQVTVQDTRIESLVDFCATPRTREEMQQFLKITNRGYFRTTILKPLLESGQLLMTIPDKPNSRNQKYVAAEAGES